MHVCKPKGFQTANSPSPGKVRSQPDVDACQVQQDTLMISRETHAMNIQLKTLHVAIQADKGG